MQKCTKSTVSYSEFGWFVLLYTGVFIICNYTSTTVPIFCNSSEIICITTYFVNSLLSLFYLFYLIFTNYWFLLLLFPKTLPYILLSLMYWLTLKIDFPYEFIYSYKDSKIRGILECENRICMWNSSATYSNIYKSYENIFC